MPSFSSLLVVAAVVATAHGNVRRIYSIDAPTPDTMRNLPYPECSSLYRVDLSASYTTQGNDLGMLPLDGRNTAYTTSNLKDEIEMNFGPEYVNLALLGADRVGMPAKDDSQAQARAKAVNSVTALTEDGATPNGFIKALMHQYYGVCVEVIGVATDANRRNNIGVEPTNSLGGRWIEVMAQTTHANQAICATDFGRSDTHDDPVHSACGQGEVYTCREANLPVIGSSGSSPRYPATGTIGDNTQGRSGVGSIMLKFHCESNCDDPLYSFFFRITASQERPQLNVGKLQQRDGENWCSMREGDDYPSSLLAPYPKNYVEPVVFDQELSSAAGVAASLATVVALMVASLM